MSNGGLRRDGPGNEGDRKLSWYALNVFLSGLGVPWNPQSVAFSVDSAMASGEISTPCAFKLPWGHRWHRRSGMQPVPVPRSNSERGRRGLGERDSESLIVQSSVSGRGIRTGGRARRLSGPNGCEPGRFLDYSRTSLQELGKTNPRCTAKVHCASCDARGQPEGHLTFLLLA